VSAGFEASYQRKYIMEESISMQQSINEEMKAKYQKK